MIPTINILTIDDHPLYVQGMEACLCNIPVVAQVDTCTALEELHQKIRTTQPLLVFLELNLNASRHDGFTLCREITTRYRHIFVAILSRYSSPLMIEKARDCGARAYFDKTNPPEVFCTFLHQFANGSIQDDFPIYINPRPRLHSGFEADAFELKCLLTKREIEVMKLIVDGKEHAEIEEELHISYDTYRTHHNNVLRKLGVQNDVLLTRFALQHNLTDEDFHITYPPNPYMRKAG